VYKKILAFKTDDKVLAERANKKAVAEKELGHFVEKGLVLGIVLEQGLKKTSDNQIVSLVKKASK
jgi:hypothetical protein